MRLKLLLSMAGGVTIVVCLLVFTGQLPLGLTEEWTWGHIPKPRLWPESAVSAAVLLIYVAIGVGTFPLVERGTWFVKWSLVAGLAIVGFVTQMALQLGGYGIAKWPFILYSPSSSGYYTAAIYEVPSASSFLTEYADFQAKQKPFHLGTHPPGLILLQYVAIQWCEASPAATRTLLAMQPESIDAGFRDVAVAAPLPAAHQAAIWFVALLSQFASVSTMLPLFRLISRGLTPQVAWGTVALWPLVPAVAIFMPKSDVLYPVLAVTFVMLCCEGDTPSGRLISGAAAGLTLCLGMFLTFGLVAVVPVAILAMTLVIGFERLRSRDGMAQFAASLVGIGIGIAVPVAVVWLATGHNLLATWVACYLKHREFYTLMPRSYWGWFGFNLAEFAVAAGLPLASIALAGVWRTYRSVERWRTSMPVGAAVTLAWFVVLMLLDISGKNRGEIARLWIFLMPFAVIAGAQAFATETPRRWQFALLWLLQGVQTIVFIASVQGFVDPRSIDLKKSEIRSTKSETKSNVRRLEIPTNPVPPKTILRFSEPSVFEVVSDFGPSIFELCFGFRASDFGPSTADS